jgi:hypothetical protein
MELRALIEDGWAAREHLFTANSAWSSAWPKNTWGAAFLSWI